MGGAFNPVHYGISGRGRGEDKTRLRKDSLYPFGQSPLKTKDLADASHRYEMTRLSIDTNPFFDISDIECRGSRKSYTVETFAALGERHPENEFFLIWETIRSLTFPCGISRRGSWSSRTLWWFQDLASVSPIFLLRSR